MAAQELDISIALPKHSGYYEFGGAVGARFYLSNRPNFTNRLFCRWCLGWQWKDVPPDNNEQNGHIAQQPQECSAVENK